ncbi:phage tail tape measure protein [Laribacter hongkongensis]|uniref:phage tail tape measure protein n=6 Tax=Laribacter hongkongensis TaxID=168471 RepID=UPI001EFD0A65|nr:phage tail tape measure protein [Laribacter hongkongensis]MCG8997698.1 phage tail tape measure protein [Laribacter hongkongensis]MCG9004610.1 phage tail tape measure protein [Laribacter hongkongensis]MCG9007484.1 phage tail tape measure protein [Laribacter hongkongensis]MCG9013120.1 phage tail tape measure protein [Laribacter hongkongensis]MCG9037561.1 phage tail tape measure protein [Laribacter hongkongensis]
MANELLVGVKIGAALSGTFQAAFASARGTSQRLGQAADELRAKHNRLGEAMARAMSHPTRNVAELRRQYDRLGQTLDQLRTKQEKLAASMARGESLKAARADLRGQAMEAAGTALALGAPVVKSLRVAAGFQDQMRDTAITGEFSRAEEAKLGSAVRDAALKWNQFQDEVARGTSVLVAGGIQDAKALEKYAPVMAKAATATRASMDDLGSVAIALKDNLKVGEQGFEGALNMLAYAGKRGQFEIRDMAKWLPALSPSFQALGVTGKEAVAEIGAALQIARKGAGSNDEAANNFKNFLQKITAPDTLKDFEKAGIDLKSSMMTLRAQGLTPVQSMLAIITQYMQSKGPAAAGQFQQAMAIKDDKEREAALQRLSEAYKLGELFQDMQAMSFIRPAIANMGEMKDIQKGSMEASDKGLLDADYKKRMEGATEQFKSFKIGMMDIGITIGDALLPPLTELIQEVRPGVKAFGDWAKEHPGLIKGVIGLVGGLLAGKMAFIGIKYGLNLVLSPFNALTTSITAVSGKWTLLRAMWQAGRFAPAISGLRALGGGIMTVGRFLLPFGQGLLMAFGGPLMLAGRGALFLGKLLAGNLVSGLRLAGQAVLWLGRAMLMNPIGLAITGIAVGAYLIYRNWDKLKGWFRGLWAEVKTAFAGGIGGVAKLILNWSPLGLFYKAFAGVMKWFGVSLPKNFSDFGGMLIGGLVGGIKAKIGAAKDAVVGFGKDIKGWFAGTLGIKSPSRVFMGFGDNIAQGAAIGIGRSAGLATKAAAGMASKTAAAATAQRLGAAQAGAAGAAGATGAGGLTIHFNPTIHVQGGTAEGVKGQITEALNVSLHELEQLIKRVVAQQARRAY